MNRKRVEIGDDSVFLGYSCPDLSVNTVRGVVVKSEKWAEITGATLPRPVEIHCKDPNLMPELDGANYVLDNEIAYDNYLFVRIVDADADCEQE